MLPSLKVWAVWPYPTPVLLSKPVDLGYDFITWSTQADHNHPCPIITPCYPAENCAQSLTPAALGIILAEIRRTFQLCQRPGPIAGPATPAESPVPPTAEGAPHQKGALENMESAEDEAVPDAPAEVPQGTPNPISAETAGDASAAAHSDVPEASPVDAAEALQEAAEDPSQDAAEAPSQDAAECDPRDAFQDVRAGVHCVGSTGFNGQILLERGLGLAGNVVKYRSVGLAGNVVKYRSERRQIWEGGGGEAARIKGTLGQIEIYSKSLKSIAVFLVNNGQMMNNNNVKIN